MDARNITASVISDGAGKRPIGIVASMRSRTSAGMLSIILVSALGEIAFTVMPKRASSFAVGLGEGDDSPLGRGVVRLAGVAVQSGVRSDVDDPARPCLPEMGTAARANRNVPPRWTSMTCLPVVVGELPDQLVAEDPGVVHHDVQAAFARDHGRPPARSTCSVSATSAGSGAPSSVPQRQLSSCSSCPPGTRPPRLGRTWWRWRARLLGPLRSRSR